MEFCPPLFSLIPPLFTLKLLSKSTQYPRVLGVSVKISKVSLLVTLLVSVILLVYDQSAGETLPHHRVMHHQPGERGEHLGEALDAEPGLGDQDQVVKDPGAIEAARNSHRQGETS